MTVLQTNQNNFARRQIRQIITGDPRRQFFNKSLDPELNLSDGPGKKNFMAQLHINKILSIPQYSHLTEHLKTRSNKILRFGKVDDGYQYVQILFELRTIILFDECERLLKKSINYPISYSMDIYSSQKKTEVFGIVRDLRSDANSLLKRLEMVKGYKSHQSHINFYKKVANLAAHHEVLKALCSIENLEQGLKPFEKLAPGISPIDYYYLLLENNDFKSPELKDAAAMRYVLLLSSVENAFANRNIKGYIDSDTTSDILKIPFYTREFMG